MLHGVHLQTIRAYAVAAVLRGVNLTAASYKSLIDLQDKLHQNICRKRTLVAIGTHDLSTLTPPFTYTALPPSDISFVPLSQSKAFKADDLLEFYRTDLSVKHIKPYVSIIDSSPVFPVIVDAAGTVLSLPPIINGEHSKITMGTRDIFIEMTATDLTKAHVVLNNLVGMFSEHCADPFHVEPVRVVYESEVDAPDAGGEQVTPDLSCRTASAEVADINGIIGCTLSGGAIAAMLPKMQLEAKIVNGGATVEVQVPPTRSDILHAVDIAEDVGIAYGYNNIVKTIPPTPSTAYQQPVNKLTDLLRVEMASAGYTECLTMALVSRAENYAMLQREDDEQSVVLGNPKTKEFEIGRTQLGSGLLKSLASNKDVSVGGGIKLFEISDIMRLEGSSDVGAVNQRNLAAVYTGPTAGFEVMHGLVDRVMTLLSVPLHPVVAAAAFAGKEGATGAAGASGGQVSTEWTGTVYRVREAADPMFLPGRAAEVVLVTATAAGGKRSEAEVVVGQLGVVHPAVLANFELVFPGSLLEMNLEHLV
jgi:phenylalanyl-tRNA synthetase beta chain